jgi:ubiquitin carboxyl-terminal hydrolase L5
VQDRQAFNIILRQESALIQFLQNDIDTPKQMPRDINRGRSPVQDSANGLSDELHTDAASITSSKRKRSPSLETTQPLSRSKRLRPVSEGPIKLNEDDFNPPYTPLTEQERNDWKGWVEVESEPIYVNTMLRELGVKGVRAEEIVDLELSILALEPPVYGLVFLFQYQDSDHIAKGEPCPSNVWFANQLPATNACATIALINILLNTKNVELGRPLCYLKEDTMDLTPMERAHCINEHEFIRGVHNSFASRVDMWLADRTFAAKYSNQLKAHKKRLRNEQRALEKAQKAKETPKAASKQAPPSRPKRNSAKKKKVDDSDAEEEAPSSPEQKYDDESAFHYVAYVPIDGHIWYLDGMSTQPQDLGVYTHEDSWLCDAALHIQARMAEFAQSSGVYFNLMALTKDSASRARDTLAASVKFLVAIENKLNEVDVKWKVFADDLGNKVLRSSNTELDLTDAMISSAPEPSDLSTLSLEKLLDLRLQAAKDQESLREVIRVQRVNEQNEQSKVEKDRLDLNPMIQRVLLDLEENGMMHGLLDVHR